MRQIVWFKTHSCWICCTSTQFLKITSLLHFCSSSSTPLEFVMSYRALFPLVGDHTPMSAVGSALCSHLVLPNMRDPMLGVQLLFVRPSALKAKTFLSLSKRFCCVISPPGESWQQWKSDVGELIWTQLTLTDWTFQKQMLIFFIQILNICVFKTKPETPSLINDYFSVDFFFFFNGLKAHHTIVTAPPCVW